MDSRENSIKHALLESVKLGFFLFSLSCGWKFFSKKMFSYMSGYLSHASTTYFLFKSIRSNEQLYAAGNSIPKWFLQALSGLTILIVSIVSAWGTKTCLCFYAAYLLSTLIQKGQQSEHAGIVLSFFKQNSLFKKVIDHLSNYQIPFTYLVLIVDSVIGIFIFKTPIKRAIITIAIRIAFFLIEMYEKNHILIKQQPKIESRIEAL